jgi:hypothetical protein
MTEFTVQQIAATLAGHLGRPESELRLLSLFRSAADERRELQSGATRELLPKAA